MMTSLNRFQHRIRSTCLFVDETNDLQNEISNQCRCVLHLGRHPPIVIKEQHKDMRQLIQHVANRAAKELVPKTEHVQQHKSSVGIHETHAETEPENQS